MSTQLNQGAVQLDLPVVSDMRVAIITAEWNSHITEAMTADALRVFGETGMNLDEDVSVFHVPGAVELTFAASQAIETGLFDVVIVFGCVIRGDTPHFDYVCQSVTQGVTALNADCDVPVIFGVLTVNDEQQALERAGGVLGNKGGECARCAISMVHLARTMKDL